MLNNDKITPAEADLLGFINSLSAPEMYEHLHRTLLLSIGDSLHADEDSGPT